ncbi:hypothetical protein AWB76_00134 [Caballeronia temeraria]|uniref:Uncharacterized protein n=2 Tax=Caballeronia temeraria TaxID=1777137 RepID=A0A157Z3F6_9BURK|nr:hypothetical protein AWB76_00134 [Caballeronia temeraria]
MDARPAAAMMGIPILMADIIMKKKRLHHAALTALLAAETLGVSSKALPHSKTANLDVALTIENTCTVDTPTSPVMLDQARRVAVRCPGAKSGYALAVEARTAAGEPMTLRSIEERTRADAAPGDEQYPPVVTVTVQF